MNQTTERGEGLQDIVLGKRAAPMTAGFEMKNNEGVKTTFKRSASDNFIDQMHQ